MKKKKLVLSTILLSLALLTACSTGDGPVIVEKDEGGEVTDESRGSIGDAEEGDPVVSGSIVPVVSGSIVAIGDEENEKEKVSDEEIITGKADDGAGIAEGEELWALAGSEEEAKEIAELYGIELVLYDQGVATFHTDEDPAAVIQRGIDNGWKALAVNKTGKLVD